jgi:hypothetical protein
MNFPLRIDASFLKSWSDCREQARQSFVEERAPVVESVYYRYGTALHKAVEEFWKGYSFERAIHSAYEVTSTYPTKLLNPYFSNKWKEMLDQLPDAIATYYDSQEQDVSKVINCEGSPMLEHEWSIPYEPENGKWTEPQVILCGRIDRVMVGPELPDVKSASEIASYGQSWKDGYTRSMMLQMQFGLYDWYLQKIGLAPRRCYLEVLLKGYKSKPPRYEVIELTHVTTEAYRQRFRQQLAFKVSEIVHYFKHYREQKPWPMSGGSACKTVYGECEFLDICLSGTIPKVMEKYKEREEHLLVRGAK